MKKVVKSFSQGGCRNSSIGPTRPSDRWQAILLPLVLCLLASPAFGQISATVSGRVTDQTGAVVPGAKVTATDVNTGAKATTRTNTQGSYAIPFLQPGTYDVSAAKSGFKPMVRSQVKLDVGQVARIDFAMQLGQVRQTVEVKGGAPMLETETSSLGQQIGSETIESLPLNGRDYIQLVTLSAGSSPNSYSRASNGFSLNGGDTFQTSLLLNGVSNNNYILGTDTSSLQAVRPSVDAIQEFKVETANYSAQYGHAAGGIVSVAIKSGTNHLHGDAFEFLRNDKLDATDFFANRSGLSNPPLKRNQFGGTLGGPVIHNRTFFFVSYEGTREVSSQTGTTTLPTPQMINGNFGSEAIYDPLNVVGGVRQEFTNNTIPAKRIDPVAANLAALYPAPNLPGTVNNFVTNIPISQPTDQYAGRFDQNFSERDKLFVVYTRGVTTIHQGSFFASPGNGGNGFGQFPLTKTPRAYSFAVGETHIFNPELVNEFHAGYNHNESNQIGPEDSPLFSQFGINGVPPLSGLNGLPMICLTGYSCLGDRTFNPNPKLVQISQANDTVSWVHGNHNIAFGGSLMFIHNYAGTSHNARGNIHFNGQFTSQTPGQGRGSAFADFLLGQTNSATLTTPLVGRLRSRNYGIFVNDSWRVTHALTLNLGLRYNLQTPMVERDNRLWNFVLDPQSSNYGTTVQAASGGYLQRGFSNLNLNNIAPRIGLAYQLNSKTVIRSAFGVFYGGLGYQDIAHSGAANPPGFLSISFPTSTTAATSNFVLSTGFPPDTLNPQRVVNPNAFALSANFPWPTVDQWNFSVQRQMPGSSVLTIAYVGSSSSYLLSDNQMNSPLPGPGAIQPRRPFPNFGSILLQTPYSHSTYHSLQARLERRFRNGLSLLATYTYSHALDGVASNEDSFASVPQNPLDIAAEKSSSDFDHRHRFVASGIYQLPMGRTSGFLGGSGASRAIFGGWEIGGIFTAQSGHPMTPSVSPNPANTGNPARPDRLCNGNLSGSQRSIDHFYDVACFTPAAPFTYGNSARGVLTSPHFVNLDALLDRTFKVRESVSLEFRAEFFNFTNTAHFGTPDLTVNQPQAGTITSTSSPSREIQFGLRLRF